MSVIYETSFGCTSVQISTCTDDPEVTIDHLHFTLCVRAGCYVEDYEMSVSVPPVVDMVAVINYAMGAYVEDQWKLLKAQKANGLISLQ
jgi:hypothetical protein